MAILWILIQATEVGFGLLITMTGGDSEAGRGAYLYLSTYTSYLPM